MKQNDAEPIVLVPPRPNLGPEDWPAPRWPSWVAAGTAILVASLVVVAVWARTRRRISRGTPPAIPVPTPAPSNDHERLAAWAELARGRLIDRFGAPWVAKTTEEIEGDRQLSEAVGAATIEKLLELLRAADRAKFAEIVEQGADWSSWVDAFLTDAPHAGAISTTNGR
jgi:hypothetical protein